MLVCIFVNGAARLRERKIEIIEVVRAVSTLLVLVERGRGKGGTCGGQGRRRKRTRRKGEREMKCISSLRTSFLRDRDDVVSRKGGRKEKDEGRKEGRKEWRRNVSKMDTQGIRKGIDKFVILKLFM